MDRTTALPKEQSLAQFGLTDLALIGMAVIWGGNFVVIKFTFLQMSPMAFMVLRFALASLLILGLLAMREHSLAVSRGDYAKFALAGLVGTTLYQLFFINGLSLSTASTSSLIQANTPTFIALINRLFGGERLGLRGWAGIALSFLGIVLIVQSSGGNGPGSSTLTGDLLILCGTVCWSVYSVLSAPLLRKYSPLKVTALATAFGTLPLLFFGAPAVLAQNWTLVGVGGWAGLTYSFVLAIVVAYVIWNRGVQRIGGSRTALYNNLTPLVASIVAAASLGETITMLKVLGALIIFAGLYLARTGSLLMEPEG